MCEPTSLADHFLGEQVVANVVLEVFPVQPLGAQPPFRESSMLSSLFSMRIWSSCLITSGSTLMLHVLAALHEQ